MKNYFQVLEEELLSEEVRKSRQKLELLLDDDFFEYGSSGKMYTKDFVLERLPNSEYIPIKILDFSVVQIGDDFVQTRFQTKEKSSISLRSSIWKKYSENNWKMLFHQGTPVK